MQSPSPTRPAHWEQWGQTCPHQQTLERVKGRGGGEIQAIEPHSLLFSVLSKWGHLIKALYWVRGLWVGSTVEA